jgi:apolipoprotein N-acyltransferase
VDYLAVLQSTAWIGIYGLSFLTVAAAATPAVLADPLVSRRAAIGALAAFGALFAGIAIAGSARLSHATDATVPGVRLRLVQGNISQHEKRAADMRLANFIKYLQLSARYAGTPVTHVIWPETAAPFALAQPGAFW